MKIIAIDRITAKQMHEFYFIEVFGSMQLFRHESVKEAIQ